MVDEDEGWPVVLRVGSSYWLTNIGKMKTGCSCVWQEGIGEFIKFLEGETDKVGIVWRKISVVVAGVVKDCLLIFDDLATVAVS